MCTCTTSYWPAPLGRMQHRPDELLPRHCHESPYAALIIEGGYVEAGDRGRFRAKAGDVLVHTAFESHINRFDARGAQVLILKLANGMKCCPHGRVSDPDAIVEAAERDPNEASLLLAEQFEPLDSCLEDWPDLLAAELSADPTLELSAWAAAHSLGREKVSRGFQLAYGISPSRFRMIAKTRKALSAMPGIPDNLADLAIASGFSDQAHMTRSIGALTGRPPGYWRRASRSNSSDLLKFN